MTGNLQRIMPLGAQRNTRSRNLQRIVNQSRFLILPWVQVQNLASHLLSLSTKRIADDWTERFNIQPLVLETLVDNQHYRGTCYRAANWIFFGYNYWTRAHGCCTQNAQQGA